MPIELSNAGKKATITVNGSIGGDVLSADFQDKLNSLDETVSEIIVNITTRGGSVLEGHAMFGMLRETGKRVVTNIIGGALSAGAVLAQAGDERRMHSNALMMVHGARGGDGASTASAHRDAIEMIDAANSAIAETISIRTGMTLPRASELLNGKDRWYTAREAKAAGLIDTIVASKSDVNAEFVASVPAEVLNELGIQITPINTEIEDMADQKPAAATSKEIKAACPGCSAEFILAQLDNSATLSDVKDAWIEQLVADRQASDAKAAAESAKNEMLANELAEAKKAPGKAGVAPVGGLSNSGKVGGDDSDPVAAWNELISDEMKGGASKQAATRACVARHPEAHAEFIKAFNASI